ncbi:hypothetical protein PENARI_c005G10874 [Penicillium arizonense]|uniref:Peroxisomal biogenesis factor 11 n=1 Tax=Penicillium arizonense TaxID=1835702 RepID=A0A1F5LQ99_PENAI|nr:hypothetical protein PENARI_c005G10874 [Penicillium arizonense]OGE55109.1 hypothetical protein PENARI_c005G10874 [Penicillium arizonense]
MAAATPLNHSTLGRLLSFLATTAGRDKSLRTLQYFSRFYGWYLRRANYPQSAVDPINVIKKQFEITRKILRIGNFIEKFNAASSTLNKKGPIDPVLRYLTTGHHLGYGVYLALDTLVLIDSIGVRKPAITKSLQRSGYRAWMAGLICSAMAGIYSLCRLYQKEQKADRKVGEGAIEAKRIHRERSTTSAQLISSLWYTKQLDWCVVSVAKDRSSRASEKMNLIVTTEIDDSV